MEYTASTLIELIEKRIEQKPDEILYTFLSSGKKGEESLTYRELRNRAAALAGYMQNVAKIPARALILISPGLGYIEAFFGCLYAGITPVPLYPPNMNSALQRLDDVIVDSQATIVLTDKSTKRVIKEYSDSLSPLKSSHLIAIDDLPNLDRSSFKPTRITGTDPAFLQYTSGSTSTPKGVILTHKNLIHNLQHIYTCFGHNDESRGVIWLPPYHDMGLIGGILQPLYGGFPVILMSPLSFIKNPAFWLETISNSKATTSGGNNFAYELCIRRVSKATIESLDLSSWKTAFNGAEPVRFETMERFAQTFAPAGFNSSAFYPCYGLAEATLIVSGKKLSEPVKTHTIDKKSLEKSKVIPVMENGKILVSNGSPVKDQKVSIVNPETFTACSQDEIGEIWVKGDSVAQGYWGKEELTKTTFHAYTKDTNEGPFLRTGDLGYIHEGELYVAGRLKDLIIIRGRNYYPQDIEATVEKVHASLSVNAGAVFSVDVDGEERLVITQEVSKRSSEDWDLVIDKIRKAVMEEYQVQPYDIVLLPRKSIIKTSSGKICRFSCKKAYLANQLSPISREKLSEANQGGNGPEEVTSLSVSEYLADPGITLEYKSGLLIEYLENKASLILNISKERILKDTPLLQYGLDSVRAVEFQHLVESELNVTISLQRLLTDSSLKAIAEEIILNKKEQLPPSQEEICLSSGPLSYGQQALLYLQRLDPKNSAYNLYYAVNVNVPIDIPVLKEVFEVLAKRHPALRTTFGLKDNKMVQFISDEAKIDFKQIDVQGLSKLEVDKLIRTEAHKPFDLKNDVLFRIRLYQGCENKQILLLTIHHIISDFWSLSILFNEIGKVYTCLINKKPVELQSLQSQYLLYVQEQNDYLESEKGKEDLEFWRKELAGPLPVMALPFDYPRPPIQSFKGSVKEFTIAPEITERLKKIAGDSGVTMYMTLLAAFKIFLFRITGQQDIILGTPATGRHKAEYSNLLGYFVNPVVMRTKLDKSSGFQEIIKTVSQNVVHALEKQTYPFPMLREKLHIEKDPSTSPVFQVMFAYQQSPQIEGIDLVPFALNRPEAQAVLGELNVALHPIKNKSTQFDLNLQMGESKGTLFAAFQYNTQLFKPSTIRRFICYFNKVLEELSLNPGQPIYKIQIMPEGEYKKTVYAWNQTEKPSSKETIPSLFEKQVEIQSDKEAVVFENTVISYADLNSRVNQWAHYLKAAGVGSETLVGVMLARTPELIVILLAIMKAGGAYLPLNPSLPKNRINWILEDSSTHIVITQERYLNVFEGYAGKVIDADKEEISAYPSVNPARSGSSGNLAYILYTSGSTGLPKGVMVEQGNVVNFMNGMDETIGCYSAATVTSLNNIAFDISVLDLWWSLTRGFRVLFLSEHAALDTGDTSFFSQAEKYKPEIVQCTPALLRHILQNESAFEVLQTVHTYIAGGEILPVELANKIRKNCNARLLNQYGPTETTVYSTSYEVRKNTRGSVSIGRPIANTEIYILDENLQPCPIGVKGEIYIGGLGVARGYLNLPEVTSQVFIPNPFAAAKGSRLYKSGDLARFLPNGNIELIGRNDFQIKIRGHRIELGEIETLILKHEAVKDCIVTTYNFQPDDKRIVAYIIAHPGLPQPTTSEIRHFLSKELPEYMLPAHVIKLESIPLTPNGKIDYKLLPAPSATSESGKYVVPKGRYEEQIAEIWRQVLKVDKISIYDNFFDLGGHSLLMPEVQDKINHQFKTNIPIFILFEYTTVNDLARYISGSFKENDRSGITEGLSRAKKQMEVRQRRMRTPKV
ncbi:MAG: amino acid adenylation domain-containing protein [Clostridia bacterium]|nr:amino acid adenylation domain-containing protein [Clostridia bacterium]